MSNSIDWGEFQGSSGDWQKFRFETAGDSIVGEITEIRIATMADGVRMPALTIKTDDGTEWSLLASQIGLQRALSTHRPATGDTIAIVFTGESTDVKPGKSPAKLFDVQVKRGDETPAPAPAPAAAAPSASSLI
jgi:hypothetical protein